MFQGRNFLTLLDYTPDEIRALLKLAHQVKAEKKQGIFPKRMANKNVVLLFEKTSTRTRCAFETAAYDEGANVTFLSNSQMGKKESLEKLPAKSKSFFLLFSHTFLSPFAPLIPAKASSLS